MVKLQREFKKIWTPTFDGESKKMTKAWLLNITKYFQIYNYLEYLNLD